MASWDSAKDVDAERVGLRCLACGRRLDEALAVVGSLRCLDCRASNAALKTQLIAGPERTARAGSASGLRRRSEEHTSELQSPCNLVCRLLLEKKKQHVIL